MHEMAINERILSRNDDIARENRRRLGEMGVFALNVVSSPGSGKTSLIEKTIERVKGMTRVSVIEGDMATDLDARRIERHGVPVRQITTGRACHLDAHMIAHTLPWVFENKTKLLIIENVGNLVCPSEYDLGEDMMAVLMSTTEGDEKPLKYRPIFHASDALVINKTDLAGLTDFDMRRARKNALSVNPGLKVFETSCVSGAGLGDWTGFLMQSLSGKTA